MTWRRLLWGLAWVGAGLTVAVWIVAVVFVVVSGSLIGPRPPAP